MAPKDEHVSGSKPVKSRSGRHRIKSSLFRQQPLGSDSYDADPIFTSIFSNNDRPSTSNPSGPLPTNSTDLSSDSNISFRRERLGLYVQNYVPPPEPQYKGLQAAHKEPPPKPGRKPVDYGAWDPPNPKPDAENSEPVLWGGASMGDSSVQWAPTSGKGKKNKTKRSSQLHFLEPPVSKIKVDINSKGMKWRMTPINGGSGTGLGDTDVDCQSKFMPWEAPVAGQDIDKEVGGANASFLAGNGNNRNIRDNHLQPRSGFYCQEPRTPFVIEVSDEEDEESVENEDEKPADNEDMADNENEEQSDWDITV
ncbi:hypothetical protein V490_01291 [Pseudogymnoascus sp. VKM F-3557]|nr:hypothetical protein V490_01291 [Pseudogymnoascus sp. VKM F-3557]